MFPIQVLDDTVATHLITFLYSLFKYLYILKNEQLGKTVELVNTLDC